MKPPSRVHRQRQTPSTRPGTSGSTDNQALCCCTMDITPRKQQGFRLARPPQEDRMTSSQPDFAAIKQRQQQVWSEGDFSMVAVPLVVVSEQLCESVDLRAGQDVLDIACGSGNTAIAAARR